MNEAEKLIMNRRKELKRSIEFFSSTPPKLRSAYDQKKLMQDVNRLLEIDCLISSLQIKNAE